jgi:hypothetical protein
MTRRYENLYDEYENLNDKYNKLLKFVKENYEVYEDDNKGDNSD